MFNVLGRIEAATNNHLPIAVDLIEIAVNPAKFRISNLAERFDKAFKVMRIPYIVLIQECDQWCGGVA